MTLTGKDFQAIASGYDGVLYRDADHPTVLAAYDTFNVQAAGTERAVLGIEGEDRGTTYLFVAAGKVVCSDRYGDVVVPAGCHFVSPEPVRVDFDPATPTRAVGLTRVGYRGLRTFGGPIEHLGRLRYIDECSDTCLVPPPLLGEPCLNHLHFPPGVAQTFHTHPSLRAGIVARGSGVCECGDGRTVPLEAGTLWIIPTDTVHRFITTDSTLDVIAYHPDSDFGPTHEDHPMVNRTWVDGERIALDERHARARVVDPWPFSDLLTAR